jgi:hypothetical protein
MDGGSRGTHRRTAAVDSEAGTGSQEVWDAFNGGSRPEDVVFCSGSVVSSGDGAPWSGSTAAFPARSAQGKEPRGLAEVRGWFLEGKEAGVSGERTTIENGLLWLWLSPSLASARERRDNTLTLG